MMEAKKLVTPRPLIRNVAFFGDADVKKSDPVYKGAFEIAELLASKGFTIVNGGGPGVMAASTRGAEAVRGETIAITFYPEEATEYEGRYMGNITDREIISSNYIDRMFKLLEHGDLFIIFKGGTGTISEFATAWALAKLYYRHHKPFILFGSFWVDIIECIKKNMNISKEELDAFRIVDKKADVFPTIQSLEKELSQIDHSHCQVCKEKEFMT